MKNKFLIIVSSILATMIVLVTTLIGIFYLSSNIPNSVTFLKKYYLIIYIGAGNTQKYV